MITTTAQHSARRVTQLARRAHDLLEVGAEPASADPWIGISVATLVVQATALESVCAELVVRPDVAQYRTVRECLLAIQDEMDIWDWDGLDRDALRAGCQFVLDVADLVGVL